MTGVPDELVEKAREAWYRIKDQVRNTADNHGGYERANADIATLEAIGLPALLERVEAAKVDTLTLSKEAFEAVGTSIQNAAGGVEYNLPEYVVIAITENLIASAWLRQRLDADRDALAAKVADVGERIALAIEAERESTTEVRSSANTWRDGMTDAVIIARAALTEGTTDGPE